MCKKMFVVFQKRLGVSFSMTWLNFILSDCYNEYVKLSASKEEWGAKVCGFIKNYGFPCVGAWNEFHVHVNLELKIDYSFRKKRYQ